MSDDNTYIYKNLQNLILIGAIPLFALLLSLLISLFVEAETGYYIMIVLVGAASLGASYLITSNIVKALDIIQPIKRIKEWYDQKKS